MDGGSALISAGQDNSAPASASAAAPRASVTCDAALKYLGIAAMFGSVFYLVLIGKVEVSIYLSMIAGAGTGLGIYHASGGYTGAPPKT